MVSIVVKWHNCWNMANANEFWRSDPEIWKPSTTDSGYQQISMAGDGGFSQTCVQECEKL
jgi:hypothetical protein